MSIAPTPANDLRCGVFSDVGTAEAAVQRLLSAGFQREHIDVVCSEPGVGQHFNNVEHQLPAGEQTPENAAMGGAMGIGVASLIALGLTTATGLPIVAFGPSLLFGGAVAGGLIGAMETRGTERAAADFYDQALSRGDLLVTVNVAHGAESPADIPARGRVADDVFRSTGARPISLPEETP